MNGEFRIAPPSLCLLTATVMCGIDLVFKFGDLGVSVAVRLPIFAIASVCALGLGSRALKELRQAKTTFSPICPENASELVLGGVYRISRNPMYLGLAIFLAGWMIFLGNALNIAPLMALIWYITKIQIRKEEGALRERFGEKYDEYCRKTRRWI